MLMFDRRFGTRDFVLVLIYLLFFGEHTVKQSHEQTHLITYANEVSISNYWEASFVLQHRPLSTGRLSITN